MDKNKREQFLSKWNNKVLMSLNILKTKPTANKIAFCLKNIKRKLTNRQKSIDKLFENRNKTDNMLCFDELGIDCLTERRFQIP